MDIKEKIQEIEYSLEFDQVELAKMLILVSTTVLIFSIHGITILNSTSERLEGLEDDFSDVSGMVNSQGFNETVDALSDVQQGSISERMQFAANTLQSLQEADASISNSADDVENMLNLYRWLLLLAVLGEVAGVSLIYM